MHVGAVGIDGMEAKEGGDPVQKFDFHASHTVTTSFPIGDLFAKHLELALQFLQPYPGDDSVRIDKQRFSVCRLRVLYVLVLFINREPEF
jgi:hypothetical protein